MSQNTTISNESKEQRVQLNAHLYKIWEEGGVKVRIGPASLIWPVRPRPSELARCQVIIGGWLVVIYVLPFP